MRNLSEVLNDILRLVPYTEEDFVADLEDVLDSVRYQPPEAQGWNWDRANEVINRYLSPDKKWKADILSIWTCKEIGVEE